MASNHDEASSRQSIDEHSQPSNSNTATSPPPTTSPGPPEESAAGAAERVYPIRSIISVDTSSNRQSSRDVTSPTRGIGTGARQLSIIDSQTWDQLQAQRNSTIGNPPTGNETPVASQGAPGIPVSSSENTEQPSERPRIDDSNRTSSDEIRLGRNENRPLITQRFEHVITEQGHAIITGRSSDGFMACEDEPIHTPGAIQSFGALVALREESEGILAVRLASENTKLILGYSPRKLFGLESFTDIMLEDQADILQDHIDFIREDTYDPCADGPEVFVLSLFGPVGRPIRLWCAVHINPANKDLIICEFELEDDRNNPPHPSDQSVNTTPTDTLGVDFTPEQLAASTLTVSQPLRVLRKARGRRGEAAAMEVFGIISQIQDQLGRTETLDALLNTTVGIAKELTGFHRVMIYQFDIDWNGIVVAELVDPSTSKDLYKGLHFPATDIPKQARDLYRINKVRILYDRHQVTSRLVCRAKEDLEHPLDLTHSYLRAMSPIHVKYLANMGVRASMSISIDGPHALWGLISLHTHGEHGMRVSFPLRKMCRLIGDTLSRNIERLSYASRLQARKLINTVPADANPSGYIIASSDDLLKLFNADYAALSIREEIKTLGGSTRSQEVLALLEYLKVRKFNSVLASHNVKRDFPDLHFQPGFKTISGMLYVPLSADGMDFIVFFRRGQLTEIKWGGNPYAKKFVGNHLEPRGSFQVWKETVLDQSREWTESEVETAAIMCLVYGKFIKVWRQNEAALQDSQLTKLLLANSAHEVRTPLNAVINYLEIALEGTLDNETRDNLTKSYSASKSLIYVINDLLDLTNAEKGQNLIKDESFDLPLTFREATDMFQSETRRKDINFTVLQHPGLPKVVLGDQRRVRQAITNLISNAVQHTSAGGVTVEISRSPANADPGTAVVQVVVHDTGSGMSHDTLETLFQELEQISEVNDNDILDQEEKSLDAVMEEQEKRVLGLGLALVSRIVRNMHGQLSVRSEEGRGSRFQISLQFTVPEGQTPSSRRESHIPICTIEPKTPLQSKEEFILVDGRSPPSEKRRSGASQRSGESARDSKSDSESVTKMPEDPVTTEETPSKDPETQAEPDVPQEEHVDIPPTDEMPIAQDLATLDPPPSVEESGVPQETSESAPAEPENPQVEQAPETQTSEKPVKPPTPTSPTTTQTLRVLIAEDDPINGKILQKRLTKTGHSMQLTLNGEECAAAYRADPAAYDVILMDIQMPIVDGMKSTQMIREFENESSANDLSQISQRNGRIPIFAVSASLLEKDSQSYTDTGFDGWIMKPINFTRLNFLFDGLHFDDARNSATYQPGYWENGGWFTKRQTT
ncbi:sensor histidine kinase/response regulator [Aspergillus steynii IBT 23096]|uniref:Sensor histidine kinase/response regulator n=1 Tax=Aspergillus steynii IBT 23096 TaxID=1392250 RepID=A0A2I2FWC3_9EURO|nr:sensor histidine kinase/response regulator [Aspergillus steynii IBT 23096]PLB44915.1 sensor histidine kinase/response regulator [Aspergillus steynii IBT 23096]